jgi:predicted amidohydrolase YtcJ
VVGSNGSSAHLAFVNGAVYTVDAARSWAQAVAVRDGRIVAVGSDQDVKALCDQHTEVVDLDGRMLVPGFQDAHVHPVGGGLDMLQCSLHDLSTAPEYLDAIGIYVRDHLEAEWILGGGWAMDAFEGGTPTAAALDAVTGERPAYLPNRDGHGVWVNSAALRIAGITEETPDPPDGRIERDERGRPTGTLHEGAGDLVMRHAPSPTADEMAEGLRKGQAYLHSLGITSWQDAIVDDHDRFGRNYSTYVDAAGRGELTARVVGALWWDRHRGPEQIEEFVDLRDRSRVGRFAATSVKIMQDGVCENFTAGVLEPYLDATGAVTENRGLSFVDPEALKGYVTELDLLGFQVHYHALGERAVRESLDAVEAALRANGPSDNRHHLAHLQVVHPDDIPRFRTLNAVANAQPLWAAHESQMDELTIPFLGEPRWRWQYPFASLVRAGAMLAMGSDWSVSSPDPIEEIHVAVNRCYPPDYHHKVENNEVFLPDERLDLPTALAAFTMGSAFVNHLDEQTGSIEPGKFADLAVIDRNLFEQPMAEIAQARVQQTYVEGELVYAAPEP